MYVYKLVNFKEKAYLFTKSGNLVYDITKSLLSSNWHNCKTGDYCSIYYYDHKNEKKRNRKTTLILQSIDFLTIPKDIQGLFYLYGKDIYSIKESMNSNQWNQFLFKYGEKV